MPRNWFPSYPVLASNSPEHETSKRTSARLIAVRDLLAEGSDRHRPTLNKDEGVEKSSLLSGNLQNFDNSIGGASEISDEHARVFANQCPNVRSVLRFQTSDRERTPAGRLAHFPIGPFYEE
jgi:hypothetical protein